MAYSVSNNPFIVPPVKLSFFVGSTDLSSKVKTLSVTRPVSGQARFSATFLNHNSPTSRDVPLSANTHPFLAKPTNQLHGTLRHHNQELDNAVQISIGVLSKKCSSMPLFLGGGYQDQQPQGSWNGYDLLYLLDVQNQHMPDIVDSSPPQMAHATLKAIAARYGISSIDFRIPDYRIRQLRRDRGTPRQWINQIIKPYQGKIRFHNQTLVIDRFIIGAANWGFKAGVNYKSFRWKESEPPPNNRYTINRLDPQKGIIGKQTCRGTSCPGRTVNIALDPPSRVVKCTTQTYNGAVIDWVFFTPDDRPIVAQADGSYVGEPVSLAKATYRPTIFGPGGTVIGVGNVTVGAPPASSYGYDILAYGASTAAGTFTNTFKGVFPRPAGFITVVDQFPFAPSVTRKVTSPVAVTPDQTRYGILEDFSNLEDPIIPNLAVLNDYGNATLTESIRKTYTGTLETPFINPDIEPGQWTELDAPMEGWGTHSLWYIEQVTYNYNQGSWSMSLLLTCGLWNTIGYFSSPPTHYTGSYV